MREQLSTEEALQRAAEIRERRRAEVEEAVHAAVAALPRGSDLRRERRVRARVVAKFERRWAAEDAQR